MTIEFSLDTPALRLAARETPWDSAVYGSVVVSIEKLVVLEPLNAVKDFKRFRNWLDTNRVGLVSCRLPHRNLIESMLLEEQDFRFVEMVLHPYLPNLNQMKLTPVNLDIQAATPGDLADLMEIAGTAFSNERFHLDPRISSDVGPKRYAQWVRNCLNHPTQTLLKITEHSKTIGLFITQESQSSKKVEWLLTAISPSLQGFGYGRRAWQAMLWRHQTQGYETVSTTIAAGNSKVLSLYARLQFKFDNPKMTFHWISKGCPARLV
jgi:hypothetical protein